MTIESSTWNAMSKSARAAMLRTNGIVVSTKDTLTTAEYLLLPHAAKAAIAFDLENLSTARN